MSAKPYVKANSIRPGKMAILPFENLTNHGGAGREFDDPAPLVFAKYTPMKIASPDAVQEAMKEVGKVSSLTRDNLKFLRGALGVDYLMVGTVYEFAAGEQPAISVGVRVLDAKSGDTLWALIVTKKGSDTGKLLDTGSVHTLAITVIEEIARSFNESVAEEHGKETGSSEVAASTASGEGEEKQETGAKAAASVPVAPPEAAAQPEQREAAREAAVVAEKQPETPAAASAPVATPEAAAQPEQREAAREAAVVAEKQPEIPAASSAPVATPEAAAQPEQREAAREAAVVAEKQPEIPAASSAHVATPEAAAQPEQREAAKEAAVVAEKQPEIPAASSAPVATPEAAAQPEQGEAAKEAAVVAEKPLESQSAAIDQKKGSAAVPETPAGEMPVQPAEKPRNDATEVIAPSPPALTLTVRIMTQPKQPERIEKSDGSPKATSTDAPARKDTEESGKGVTHKVAAAMTVEAATCPEGPVEVKSASPGPLPELVIHFETDKSLVKPAYHGQIANIAAFLKSNPANSLYIEGHANYLRSPSYNLALSKRRADAVRRYLERYFSVASSRITTSWLGCSQPAADNKTPEGLEKNRRAVIRIIDSNQSGK